VEIEVRQVGVDGPRGPLLRPTSLRIQPGRLALVAGDPGSGHTALALALAGQLRPSTGLILVDGKPGTTGLRRRVAVVDAPQVSEPDDGLRLSAAIAEELSLTGAPAGRKHTARWLAEHDAGQYATTRVQAIPAAIRTRLLLELAASRPGVETLVLDCPDRHTDDANSWWELARGHAERGRAVVVLCTNSSARLIDAPAARLGQHDQPAPLVAEPSATRTQENP
jgi:ABC-type multidrug transport system ATPase subunit